ncbi:hypothetical protein CONPUDRAFT_153814 [Coniophora puteana RWD-64-598 SS2]|uniref:Uncharacterized protein n=1 Tax=Coniophora puteana (strain RWD-64-598) TaxID=741705 RepID=A0A5M3MRI0_CONPW|nr:uncharacterized protein CONPUDRAFT_153814 [Coniophora puteana RWD-64-598 SS2]EIW81265.1 hypothetical protein CONPUDRAFT_153814 [Coniophora puteana RWD-64-598 SS2]
MTISRAPASSQPILLVLEARPPPVDEERPNTHPRCLLDFLDINFDFPMDYGGDGSSKDELTPPVSRERTPPLPPPADLLWTHVNIDVRIPTLQNNQPDEDNSEEPYKPPSLVPKAFKERAEV